MLSVLIYYVCKLYISTETSSYHFHSLFYVLLYHLLYMH